jgi:hypothetical protein
MMMDIKVGDTVSYSFFMLQETYQGEIIPRPINGIGEVVAVDALTVRVRTLYGIRLFEKGEVKKYNGS